MLDPHPHINVHTRCTLVILASVRWRHRDPKLKVTEESMVTRDLVLVHTPRPSPLMKELRDSDGGGREEEREDSEI